jgi:hypothetical protein
MNRSVERIRIDKRLVREMMWRHRQATRNYADRTFDIPTIAGSFLALA